MFDATDKKGNEVYGNQVTAISLETSKKQKIHTLWMRCFACAAFQGLLSLGWQARAAEVLASTDVPSVNDAALLKLFAAPEVVLPPRLFTSETAERLRQGKPSLVDGLLVSADLGQRFAKEIGDAQWRELIPPYTAFTMRAQNNQNVHDSGICPFCGKKYGGTIMTLEDFFAHPFQGKTGCCGATVYEREADMPADYKARPNQTVKIPNLDGTEREYRFYVPPGMEKAGEQLGHYVAPGNAGTEVIPDSRNWFCSASEVWWAREQYFQAANNYPPSAISALAAAAFQLNDAKAGRALAIIYDRLAEVLPGYQLVDFLGTPNGIARGADGKNYLTAEEYRSTSVPAAWKRPDWLRIPPYYNLGKLNHAPGWQDGVMLNCGNMAAIFDLIRDRPEVIAYSKERYGDEKAWEKKARKGVVDEFHFLGQCSTPDRGGNTTFEWIIGATRLGLVAQDRYFIDTVVSMIAPVIDNHYFADGLSVEGAFNYAAMMRPIIGFAEVLRESLGLDFSKQHQMLSVIDKRSDVPVSTLYGVESMHSDEHAFFFTGNGTNWKIPPVKPDYPAHEVAQCDPIYGLACLRAGGPGHRMETIMDFQEAVCHTHDARLNVQMFYEGINLLPSIGYACVAADVTKPPYSTLQYAFEKLPLPPGTDFWGAWYYGYASQTEVHCTALVDGDQGMPYRVGPITFQRFLGGAKFGEPGYNAQFLEVDGRGLYNLRPKPVDVFDRQLVALTLADGRPLTLDFFRIRGGRRHDLLWHAPATGPDDKLDTSLGKSASLTSSLNDVLNAGSPDRLNKSAPGQGSDLIRRLERWDMPDGTWQATFHVEPAHFNPVTEGGKKIYEPWMKALHNVDLRLWGSAIGSPTSRKEIFSGRSPWPSKIWEVVGGQELRSTISLKDAFHVFVESRIGATNNLSTTYVHVLDPFNPDQMPVVNGVETYGSTQPEGTAMGAGLKISLNPTGTLLAATTADGGGFTGGGMILKGRLGVAEPAAHRLTLFDGTKFSTGDFGVETGPGWEMKLLGVFGDLTGHPGESALLVETSRPLPTNQTLVGRMLTVFHQQISPYHSTGYTIERVSAAGKGRYRIDLHNIPSFMVNRLLVTAVDEKDPRRVKIDYWLLKGNNEKGVYDGRRVRIPSQNFETAMTLAATQIPFHHAYIELAEAPPKMLKRGDPVVIYEIQPGDKVVIPSHFACQGEETPQGLKLELAATDAATLTVPGTYKKAVLLTSAGQKEVSSTTVAEGGAGLRVKLRQKDLVDGRAILLLTGPASKITSADQAIQQHMVQ